MHVATSVWKKKFLTLAWGGGGFIVLDAGEVMVIWKSSLSRDWGRREFQINTYPNLVNCIWWGSGVWRYRKQHHKEKYPLQLCWQQGHCSCSPYCTVVSLLVIPYYVILFAGVNMWYPCILSLYLCPSLYYVLLPCFVSVLAPLGPHSTYLNLPHFTTCSLSLLVNVHALSCLLLEF